MADRDPVSDLEVLTKKFSEMAYSHCDSWAGAENVTASRLSDFLVKLAEHPEGLGCV